MCVWCLILVVVFSVVLCCEGVRLKLVWVWFGFGLYVGFFVCVCLVVVCLMWVVSLTL